MSRKYKAAHPTLSTFMRLSTLQSDITNNQPTQDNYSFGHNVVRICRQILLIFVIQRCSFDYFPTSETHWSANTFPPTTSSKRTPAVAIRVCLYAFKRIWWNSKFDYFVKHFTASSLPLIARLWAYSGHMGRHIRKSAAWVFFGMSSRKRPRGGIGVVGK